MNDNYINNNAQPQIAILQDALARFHSLEAITGTIVEKVLAGNGDELDTLLNQRQELMAEIDGLKILSGMDSWMIIPTAESKNSAELAAINQEIITVLNRLILQDQRIKQDLQTEMNGIRGKLINMKQAKQANQVYRSGMTTAEGVFLDHKR